MRNLSINLVDNKLIFFSLIIATTFHIILIPLSSLIKLKTIEDVEPKIVLELINNIQDNIPVKNNITSPKIIQPEKLIKPSAITPPKDIDLKPIENTTLPIDLSEDIILPDNLTPLINNKIDIPINIKKPNDDISVNNLVNIIQPKQIRLDEKPSKIINKPEFLITPQTLQPSIINENFVSQNIDLPEKPLKEVVNTNTENVELSVNEINTLKDYKSNIRAIIQSFAINNYPKKDLRRGNEGIVHIIFRLKEDGNIDYINTGPNTNATKSLIDAAIDSVRKSAPFEQIKLLKKENEFEISIIYKIN